MSPSELRTSECASDAATSEAASSDAPLISMDIPLPTLQSFYAASQTHLSHTHLPPPPIHTSWSATSLLTSARGLPSRAIVTFSKSLDTILPAGIPAASLTEVTGVSGAGKTTLCMQVAVNTTIGAGMGGVDGRVLWIDTEGGFSPPLVASIAAGLSRHVKQWSKQSSAKSSASPKQLTTNDILGRINVADCSTIHSLKGIIEEVQRREKGDLRLIVLDSLAYLVRGLPTNKERTLVVSSILQSLNALATASHMSVLVTNHVSTRYSNESVVAHEVVPTMDVDFGTNVATRVHLKFGEGTDRNGDAIREASVVKGVGVKGGCGGLFVIRPEGIRDKKS